MLQSTLTITTVITSRPLMGINCHPLTYMVLFGDEVLMQSPGHFLFFIQPGLTLNGRSPCLSLLNAGLTSAYYQAQVSFFLILSSSLPLICSPIILLHNPGWTHTQGKTLSDSRVLTSQVCATTPSFKFSSIWCQVQNLAIRNLTVFDFIKETT